MAPLTLGGVAIPLSPEFQQLGVGQRLAAEKGMGLVLRGRLDKGLAIMRRVGCLPTFLMREAALGALANSVALYGVELATSRGAPCRRRTPRQPRRSGAPHGARGPRRPCGASWLGAFMYCPCGACDTSACCGSPARHHADPSAGGTRESGPAALQAAGRPPTGLAATRRLVALGHAWTADPAPGAGGRRRPTPPRAQELALSGVPGAGAAAAGQLRGAGRSRATGAR